MSAYWIKDKIQGVTSSVAPKKTKLILEGPFGTATAYVVDGEYYLDQDVVSRAIKDGAEHIVYFEITKPTIAGEEFAKSNGLKIWPVGKFMAAVRRGRL